MRYAVKYIIPIFLEILPKKKTGIINKIEAPIIEIISKKISEVTVIGCNTPLNPKTKSTLNILLPIILPTAIAPLF